MARVASRHLSGTLTTPNRLLRFPVETTERASEPRRNVQSASQRRCRFRPPSRATKKFPFFFFFWEKAAAGLYFRWKRTLPSGNHSSNAVPIETVNFFSETFFYFLSIFCFHVSRVDMYFKMRLNIRGHGWRNVMSVDFESRGIKSPLLPLEMKYLWM